MDCRLNALLRCLYLEEKKEFGPVPEVAQTVPVFRRRYETLNGLGCVFCIFVLPGSLFVLELS